MESDTREDGPGRESERVDRHKDGSVRARGSMLDGQLHGYWEWFRKDGTKLRSGHFDRGAQVGRWTTYDAAGKVYKVTEIKATGTATGPAKPTSKPKPKTTPKTKAKPKAKSE